MSLRIIDRIPNDYVQWVKSLVASENGLNYTFLLTRLDSIEFIYEHPMDENRYNDGLSLRSKYAYANGLAPIRVRDILEDKPCSILEMMVALAIRINNIMDDVVEERTTTMWFWKMIDCLGLMPYTDDHPDRTMVDDILYRFLHRQYDPVTGYGSLFPNVKQDPEYAQTEIWYQMTGYLNQFI